MTGKNKLFLNTVLLGGTTEQKIEAAAAAGFSQIELWQQDVWQTEGGAHQVTQWLKKSEVSLTDYQVLLDFDGASEAQRESKRQEALEILDTAVRVGADTVLVPANTAADCRPDSVIDDLRWLVDQAVHRELRIAYEAMSWSTFINTTPQAWAIVQEINSPALGLVIDAFHIFVLNRTADDLRGIPADKIFLVQLSDVGEIPPPDRLIEIARHSRLLPGAGILPVNTLLRCLSDLNYQGPVGLEVFNEKLKAQDPRRVAQQAFTALNAILARANL